MRHAIRDHIRSGAALSDEHVTSAADARAIMGAIRAGRIKPEDAPPSVRRLMERMEREGVDPATADPSRIQQFLDQNPNALEEAKRLNTESIGARVGVTGAEILTARAEEAALKTGQSLPSGQESPQKQPPGQEPSQKQPQPLVTTAVAPQPPRQTTSTLDLG